MYCQDYFLVVKYTVVKWRRVYTYAIASRTAKRVPHIRLYLLNYVRADSI